MTTIHHHPSDETLAAYAVGSLDEGRQIVVAAHIEMCASCARMTAAADVFCGMRLDAIDPTPMEPASFLDVLNRIDTEGSNVSLAAARKPEPPRRHALAGYELGPWRWIGPGVHWRPLFVPSERGARVFVLKAAPGTGLPHHTHTGAELTLILQGAFAHEGGRFGVGDFDEADSAVEHQPIVESGDECICLVAMEGQLKLLGLIGRILQPFVRM